jgi:hypothetical protein
MSVEIIKSEDFGIEKSKANELTQGLVVVKSERELLINEFKEVSRLEITQENLPKFKELRLKIVKNRTQGINKWHKTNKEFFLTGGKFVDAIKNKENAINEQMEEKLLDAEKHFENLEKERLTKLQSERVVLLSEFVEDAHERDLSSMEQDVWESYLATKKQSYLDKIAEEKRLEEERQAKIKAEKEEQERIRIENAKLKAEAEAKEKALEIERKEAKEKQDAIELKAKQYLDKVREEQEMLAEIEQEKRDKIERVRVAKEQKERIEQNRIANKERLKRETLEKELQAKKDAEIKAKQEEETRLQNELSKGDADKVHDLITDLEKLKTKYTFKSAKNQKLYKDVGLLIDKITNHIENI